MKLLGSTKNKITRNESGDNVPHLEITEVVLIHCNIVNKDYQQDSGVLHILVPNKSFRQLLDISPKNFIFVKSLDSDFSYIDRLKITLVVNESVEYKIWHVIQFYVEIEYL